jgi:ATPase subunit of ABC transporter with duplicated ATPase domains
VNVCGCFQVGSGKSSLLAAMLGEMVMCEGEQRVDPARIGYVAQTVRSSRFPDGHCETTVFFSIFAVVDPEHVGS